jgi:hypothetical protein
MAANIGIVVAAAFLVGVLTKNHFHNKQPVRPPSVGDLVSIPDVHWSSVGKTVVIVMRPGCPACEESVAFHRRLAARLRADGVPVIGVFENSVGHSRAYLSANNIPIEEVQQTAFSKIGIEDLPTLMIVGPDGKLVRQWVGFLRPEDQQAVLTAVH